MYNLGDSELSDQISGEAQTGSCTRTAQGGLGLAVISRVSRRKDWRVDAYKKIRTVQKKGKQARAVAMKLQASCTRLDGQ